jgi:hypothetical protein
MRRFNVVSDLYGVSSGLGLGGALAVLSLDAMIFLTILAVAGFLEDAHPTGPINTCALVMSLFDFALAVWALISIVIRLGKGRPKPAPSAWSNQRGDAAPQPGRRRGRPRGESEPPWG